MVRHCHNWLSNVELEPVLEIHMNRLELSSNLVLLIYLKVMVSWHTAPWFNSEIGLLSVQSLSFFRVLWFLPTSQKNVPVRIHNSKLPLAVHECLNIYPVMEWTCIPSRPYSCFTPSDPGIDFRSTTSMTKIMCLLKMNEWLNESAERHLEGFGRWEEARHYIHEHDGSSPRSLKLYSHNFTQYII